MVAWWCEGRKPCATLPSLETFNDLLKAGKDPNAKDPDGDTPLLALFKKGTDSYPAARILPLIELLVRHGANVHVADRNKLTLLHLIILDEPRIRKKLPFDHYEMAERLLLSHQVDINAEDSQGATPLHTAVRVSVQVKFLHFLLVHRANVNANNFQWYDDPDRWLSPLHVAVGGTWNRCGNEEIARILLDHQADINLPSSHGNTPLHFAVGRKGGDMKLVNILMSRGANELLQNKAGISPFRKAFDSRNTEIVQFFLSNMIDTDIDMIDSDIKKGKEGTYSVFFHALLTGNRETLEDCLRREKSLANATLEGVPALTVVYTIAKYPFTTKQQIVQDLIESGANLAYRDGNNRTFLQLICKDNSQSYQQKRHLIKLVLDSGAEVSVGDIHGDTPLHVAIELYDDLGLARLLLEYHADVNKRNVKGNSPLALASSKANLEKIRLLLGHGANVNTPDSHGNTPLQQSTLYDSAAIIQVLLDRGAKVSVQDEYGNTPLHNAVAVKLDYRVNFLKIIQLLLDHGADVCAQNKQGNTSLHVATSCCYHTVNAPEIFKVLLDHGADVSVQNTDGNTPLHLAVLVWDCSPRVIQLLIDLGSDVFVQDNCGNTALHLAVKGRCHHAVPTLLERGANIITCNLNDETPLELAAKEGELNVIYAMVRSSPYHLSLQLWQSSSEGL